MQQQAARTKQPPADECLTAPHGMTPIKGASIDARFLVSVLQPNG
jgi:hypothetical protein